MLTLSHPRAPDGHGSEDCRAVSEILSRIGDKWTVLVVQVLGRGPARFSELRRAIGGISQKILPALRGPEFRAAFEDKAPHSALLHSIPTYVVTHPVAALAGLAAFARMPDRFGVATEGRRWKR